MDFGGIFPFLGFMTDMDSLWGEELNRKFIPKLHQFKHLIKLQTCYRVFIHAIFCNHTAGCQ